MILAFIGAELAGTGGRFRSPSQARNSEPHSRARVKAAGSPGPDDIQPQMLKELSSSISLHLAILYQKSLDSRELPDIWKQARVVPIHKKGSKQEKGNYHLISLISVVSKVLE